ncbi:hypothetical protein J27TS7_13180 [Paenibacillus dendritiformis]|nr:hypothetical protein J27TS7_13180 [Paenibacillus dendritiformis]
MREWNKPPVSPQREMQAACALSGGPGERSGKVSRGEARLRAAGHLARLRRGGPNCATAAMACR